MDYSDLTDSEIVVATLLDKEVFRVLVSRYEDPLGRYIARLGVHNNDDRTDLLQDIFIKIYKNLNGFDTALSFSSWAYRITHNETISWFRKKSVRPEGHLAGDMSEMLDTLRSEDAEEVVFDVTLRSDELGKALRHIDEKYRDILILRYFEHKEYAEISDILKIPTGTVGTLLHRAKAQLRKHIDKKKYE